MFQYFTDSELRSFVEICELREFETGQRILEQGSMDHELYIIIRGAVDILKRVSDGSEITVSVLETNDVFGEASIFLDVARTASAIAKNPVALVYTTRESLFTFCNTLPHAGLKIFSHIIYSLLNKLAAAGTDLARDRETMVTEQDMELLRNMFPSLDEVIGESPHPFDFEENN